MAATPGGGPYGRPGDLSPIRAILFAEILRCAQVVHAPKRQIDPSFRDQVSQ
jgi:hypothetical protein